MKVVLVDFNYKGEQFERCEFNLPNLHEIDDDSLEEIKEYIIDNLEDVIDFNGGFKL